MFYGRISLCEIITESPVPLKNYPDKFAIYVMQRTMMMTDYRISELKKLIALKGLTGKGVLLKFQKEV